jgi:2-aminoethylphosphonate-pyruvate transaminase
VHVVVLAAGRGSRLGGRGAATPKWLLSVGGRTLAERQLEAIGAAGEDVASVHVVTGHGAAAVERALARAGARAATIHNAEFATLNNWWSALVALRALPADGPVAVINADLLVDPAHACAFLAAAAGGADDALMAVDLERPLTEESMKVACGPEGTVRAIGKVGVPDAAGEYVGMLMARGAALRALRAELEGFVGRPGCAQEWYEGAVARTVAAGVAWHVWPMPGAEWVEIDDELDLWRAEGLASRR